MPFEPWRPQGFQSGAPKADADFKPADEDVIRTLAEIEKASTDSPPSENMPIAPGSQGPSLFRTASPILFVTAAASVALAVFAMNYVGARLSGTRKSSRDSRSSGRPAIDSALQAQAEQLLQRVAAGADRAIS